MKRIFILCIILCSTLSYSQSKLKVVASASMFADMTKNIAGDLVDLETIVPIGGDPHLHDPVPRDARIVSKADLILINGLTFEGWINELIDNSGTKATVVTITEGVDAIESIDYKDSADPHAWMDASNGRIYIKNIKNALVKLDPIHADTYEENYKIYDQKLVALHKDIQSKLSKIDEGKRILITSHDAFSYFGKAYDIRLEPIVGISTEAEAQTSDIQRVAKVIREQGIPAVFVESTINPKLIKQLAKDNGAVIGGKLYADSLGEEDGPAGTYLGMLDSNVNSIYNGLMKSQELVSDNSSTGIPWMTYGIMAIVFIISLLVLFKFISN